MHVNLAYGAFLVVSLVRRVIVAFQDYWLRNIRDAYNFCFQGTFSLLGKMLHINALY